MELRVGKENVNHLLGILNYVICEHELDDDSIFSLKEVNHLIQILEDYQVLND